LLELRGDLDIFSLPELGAALERVASLRHPALVDLSGVTFLDARSVRELAMCSWLHSHRVAFVNPSWQVLASLWACGLGERVRFGPAADPPEAGVPPTFPDRPDLPARPYTATCRRAGGTASRDMVKKLQVVYSACCF
jgi:anti-anti-sigma regulatory factor